MQHKRKAERRAAKVSPPKHRVAKETIWGGNSSCRAAQHPERTPPAGVRRLAPYGECGNSPRTNLQTSWRSRHTSQVLRTELENSAREVLTLKAHSVFPLRRAGVIQSTASKRRGGVHPTTAVVSGSTCCTNGLRCSGNWPFHIGDPDAGLKESSFGYGWMGRLSDFGHHGPRS